jgi:predicted acyltransferase
MSQFTTSYSVALGQPGMELSSPRPLVCSYPACARPSQRLVSLDALRGLAMFWIMGGRELVLALVAVLAPAQFDAWETQMTHPRWEGFVAWDMIMPVFLFLVGASMPFAMAKRVAPGEGRAPVYWRIARRVVVLWVLGMIAQGTLLKYKIEGLELFSNTLQAIAIGYLVTALALMHLRVVGQVVLFALLALSYWVLLAFVPFPGHSAGTLERTANLPRYVDELLLGSFRRDHDFTWVVTSLGFSATVILGAMAGHLLKGRLPVARKLYLLTTVGLACLAVGWLWSYSVPLNRHLWTSSMILWAGGWSFLLVALFYGVIDVGGSKRWAFPLVVIGANALLAYVFDHVFDRTLSDTLVSSLAQQWPAPYDELLRSIGEVGLLWLILWYLYRNRTFLRA